MNRVIAVFGATGKQGGGVAAALLAEGKFTVRAVTRNQNSAKAQALKTQGAELVEADLEKPETIPNAVKGAYGCFLITDYWAHMSMPKEIAQGKSVVDACKAAGVKHLVFSGLENIEATVGKPCPHFDGKAHIVDYIKEAGVPNSIVELSLYMENFLTDMKPQPEMDANHQPTGSGVFKMGFDLGDQPLYVNSAQDIGRVVRSVFNDDSFIGKTVGIASDNLKMEEYASIMAEVTGRNVVFNKGFTPAVLESLDGVIPCAKEFAAMFQSIAEGHQVRDPELTMKLDPEILKYRQWCINNKEALLAAMPL